MREKQIIRRFKWWWLPAALVLTLCGLLHVSYVHCSAVDPSWPAFRSDYVETRGLPDWLITDDSLCAASLPWPQRFLAIRLAGSFVLSLLVVLVASVAISWRGP